MERIVIPGSATYSPVALSDVMLGAPVTARILLGASAPGQALQAVAAAAYLGSAARDRWARRNVRPVDFQKAFGVDVDTLEPMPEGMRLTEMRELSQRLSDAFTAERIERKETAVEVDRLLTRYIATITEQEVVTSSEIRSFTLAKVAMPFALGACDPISGDVAIFQDTGILEPHVIAHEFCHRKGYLKELHAQVLAFLCLRVSANPVFVQSARAERLGRHLSTLADSDNLKYHALLDDLPLRPELEAAFRDRCPRTATRSGPFSQGMRALYDRRMKLTGQNGISDYDRGFTDFLWTFRNSTVATQPLDHAAL